MSSAVRYTPRTGNAIRVADGLKRDLTPPKKNRVTLSDSGSSGTDEYWAKITDVTDANNYECSIWDRVENEAIETEQSLFVWDIVDSLAEGNFIKVVASALVNSDYENANQLGALGV